VGEHEQQTKIDGVSTVDSGTANTSDQQHLFSPTQPCQSRFKKNGCTASSIDEEKKEERR